MSLRIQLTIGAVQLQAELRNTPTAQAIAACLPIVSSAHTWGDEVYFEVPVQAQLEDEARDVVESGELAFWVEGSCIAIGFGPTPISRAGEIRLAARTNIWAHSRDDLRDLRQVRPGDRVLLETLT